MPIRVTVTDVETGESETREVADGDYVCIPVAPCYLDGRQVYPTKGTHVLTIKGHAPRSAAQQAAGQSPMQGA
jgi:hypothetical protein